MRKLYLFPLLFSLALTSCKEGKHDPAPQPIGREVSFNFRLDPLPEETEDFELIVSQKDGHVLLDTVIAARTKHELKVNSDDTLFDVTTIYSDPATKKYSMRTYVQVNPDNWHIDDGIGIRTEEPRPNTTVYYSNAINTNNYPSHGSVHFGARQVELSRISFLGKSADTLKIEYGRKFATDLTYMLMAEQGKYIFAEVTSPEAHIDFTNTGTAIKRKYSRPDGVPPLTSALFGYTKAGDYTHPISLYLSSRNPAEYDLQFPQTLIEEFEVILSYVDRQGYMHKYWHVGSTVPEEMPLLPKSDFTVIKSKFSDFQVQFGEDKPSTYNLLWRSSTANLNAEWQVFLSPEETAFNMEGFIEKLSPASLEGKTLSDFRLFRVLSHTAKDRTHQSMHDYLNNPEAYLRKELRQYRRIYIFP
ncbi:hypothetical protein [Pontibacter pamirensis]|uniref:hypothetical protein n=1 Tax=Pontibacter pamirensis TaxID=2562824 RepID=UPI0013897CA5|nr:hypothetical protein [Pontibacter pamirensis]